LVELLLIVVVALNPMLIAVALDLLIHHQAMVIYII
jgi:hypothetical protein